MARFRVYAVTGRDRWLCSPLFLLIFLQTVGSATETAIHMTMPGGLFDACSSTPTDGHPDPKLPTEILELFRICVHMQWKPGATAYSAVALAFGALSPSILYIWSSGISRVLRNRYLCLFDTPRWSQEGPAA